MLTGCIRVSVCALALVPVIVLAQATTPGDRIRGLVKPHKRAVISSQIQARIDQLPFEDGDRFGEGDLLVEFDCSLYKANLSSAGSEYQARKRRHKNNDELGKLEAIADIDVRVSEAEMRKAAADVQAARITVERCVIKAPFDGRVAGREVNQFENVAADQPLMTILGDRELEIELIVPSRWLKWVRVDTPFAFVVDETGDTHNAKVQRIGASVDPVSQTIRLTGVLPAKAENVLAGMSGTAAFKRPTDAVAVNGAANQ